jgi:anti-anti-sigma factor
MSHTTGAQQPEESEDEMNTVRIPQPVGVTSVRPVGRLDASTARLFRYQMTQVIEMGHQHIVVDLSAVTAIDGNGLEALLHSAQAARQANGNLAIAHNEHDLPTQQLPQLALLKQVLAVYATVEEAVKAFEFIEAAAAA